MRDEEYIALFVKGGLACRFTVVYILKVKCIQVSGKAFSDFHLSESKFSARLLQLICLCSEAPEVK